MSFDLVGAARVVRPVLAAIVLAPFAAGFAGMLSAAEVTLRVHHFLSTTSTVHAQLVEPWARKVEQDSGGRIAVQIFPAMQLGGKPPQLYDQVRDGVVDIVWTLPGYTPGRFPIAEVFELPFVAGSAAATTEAFTEFAAMHLAEEFGDVHPLLFHVHAPGGFHMRGKAVRSLEDFAGVRVRAPTRVSNDTLARLGAVAVGMPVPTVPESLSKGVIDGALLPWEVMRSLRAHELTDNHTEVGWSVDSFAPEDRGLYTAIFLFAMNKSRYESLPADLRQVIDANSGAMIAAEVGRKWDDAERAGRDAAVALGHAVERIEGAELERWKAATQSVVDTWVADMSTRGVDGQALIEDARMLVRKYSLQ